MQSALFFRSAFLLAVTTVAGLVPTAAGDTNTPRATDGAGRTSTVVGTFGTIVLELSARTSAIMVSSGKQKIDKNDN